MNFLSFFDFSGTTTSPMERVVLNNIDCRRSSAPPETRHSPAPPRNIYPAPPSMSYHTRVTNPPFSTPKPQVAGRTTNPSVVRSLASHPDMQSPPKPHRKPKEDNGAGNLLFGQARPPSLMATVIKHLGWKDLEGDEEDPEDEYDSEDEEEDDSEKAQGDDEKNEDEPNQPDPLTTTPDETSAGLHVGYLDQEYNKGGDQDEEDEEVEASTKLGRIEPLVSSPEPPHEPETPDTSFDSTLNSQPVSAGMGSQKRKRVIVDDYDDDYDEEESDESVKRPKCS